MCGRRWYRLVSSRLLTARAVGEDIPGRVTDALQAFTIAVATACKKLCRFFSHDEA